MCVSIAHILSVDKPVFSLGVLFPRDIRFCSNFTFSVGFGEVPLPKCAHSGIILGSWYKCEAPLQITRNTFAFRDLPHLCFLFIIQ